MDYFLSLLKFNSTKFIDDDWMASRGFLDSPVPKEHVWWWEHPISSLKLHKPVTISNSVTCNKAIEILNREGFDQLPVVADCG